MLFNIKWSTFVEIGTRLVLWWSFIWLEFSEPFIREIQQNELWQYQYPVKESYVSPTNLWLLVLMTPTILFVGDYLLSGKNDDVISGISTITLSYGLNGLITSYLKVIVGRPRPNFFYRCFPDGKGDDFMKCTGNRRSYFDGRKSFPSGHSSFSFTCMTFTCLYLTRRLQLFQNTKNVKSWQVCLCLLPLMVAASVAVSRTCDYHHHYTDVLAGSLLGSVISYLTFCLYFPKEVNVASPE